MGSQTLASTSVGMGVEFFLVHFLKRLLDDGGGNLRGSLSRGDQRAAEAVALWVSGPQAFGVPMAGQLGRSDDRDFGGRPGVAALIEPFLKKISSHLADAPPFLAVRALARR